MFTILSVAPNCYTVYVFENEIAGQLFINVAQSLAAWTQPRVRGLRSGKHNPIPDLVESYREHCPLLVPTSIQSFLTMGDANGFVYDIQHGGKT